MLHEYQDRRDRVWEWLTEDPRFTCLKPRGAFYLFPYAADALEPAGLRTTAEFAEALLQEALSRSPRAKGSTRPGSSASPTPPRSTGCAKA